MKASQLAIHGGDPVFTDGQPDWPISDDQMLCNLQMALTDGSWGKYEAKWTEQLAEKLSALIGVEHVLLCSSGTVAVEIALRALNIQTGDEVIIAAYDFPGNFRAIESVGARPVIVDVVENGWSIDPEQIKTAISGKTAAVIGSHMHGQLLDCHHIREICDHSGIKFVEDVCQTPGASIGNKQAGSFGDVAAFSFGGSKLLSAGRGGAVVTDDSVFYQRAKIFCNRGNEPFPLSQLQAAVLLPQLDQLSARNQIRTQRVEQLKQLTSQNRLFSGLQQTINVGHQTAYYKLPWLIREDRTTWSRDDLVCAFQAEGVAIGVGFRGFTRRSPRRCRHHGSLINSNAAAERTLILHHPILLQPVDAIDKLGDAIEKVTSNCLNKS